MRWLFQTSCKHINAIEIEMQSPRKPGDEGRVNISSGFSVHLSSLFIDCICSVCTCLQYELRLYWIEDFVYLTVSVSVCDLVLCFCASSCRPVYVSAVRPQSKHIVVMVDHGASVTDTQLQIARDSALVILNAIDEHDKVSGTGWTSLSINLKIHSKQAEKSEEPLVLKNTCPLSSFS